MKKLFQFMVAAMATMPIFAQEMIDEAAAPIRESKAWPTFFAVCDYPDSMQVVGLRLTIPFSVKQDSVTGVDMGFWGRSTYFEGFQFNILRNDVKDDMAGFQFGLYNSVGGGDLLGLQAGIFNEANSIRGAQLGIVNIAGETEGFQVGLINLSETMFGYQIGLINVIRDAELQFCPIVNIGF